MYIYMVSSPLSVSVSAILTLQVSVSKGNFINLGKSDDSTIIVF